MQSSVYRPAVYWTGIILKIGIVLSALFGIRANLDPSDPLSMGLNSLLLYFTIQSNLWIAGISIVFLGFDLAGKGERKIPNWLYALKFMFTASILLTFVVFSLLLIPLVPPSYLTSPSNLLLHNLTPLLAVADFLLCDFPYKSKARHAWLGLVMPLLYLAFTLLLSFNGVRFGGKVVPYFFLDYETLGWFSVSDKGFGVVYWVFILSALLLGMSAGLLKLKDWRHQRTVSSGRPTTKPV